MCSRQENFKSRGCGQMAGSLRSRTYFPSFTMNSHRSLPGVRRGWVLGTWIVLRISEHGTRQGPHERRDGGVPLLCAAPGRGALACSLNKRHLLFSYCLCYQGTHSALGNIRRNMDVGKSELSRISEIGCCQARRSLSVYFFLV